MLGVDETEDEPYVVPTALEGAGNDQVRSELPVGPLSGRQVPGIGGGNHREAAILVQRGREGFGQAVAEGLLALIAADAAKGKHGYILLFRQEQRICPAVERVVDDANRPSGQRGRRPRPRSRASEGAGFWFSPAWSGLNPRELPAGPAGSGELEFAGQRVQVRGGLRHAGSFSSAFLVSRRSTIAWNSRGSSGRSLVGASGLSWRIRWMVAPGDSPSKGNWPVPAW